ncbi:MAG TPA: glycerol-3-phosphate dehydrogenase/oxidase [Symbiobacteriaceae bacterium]|nr:glycerol-3-phosphate dehydrogenase/oxidase [Symbiobacteriaceae bacterium]
MSSRASMIAQLQNAKPFDLIVIGGGITGCGVAYEAAAKGARVLVLEKNDFASGTSSRSTKLIHGGIRYLKHADFRLVKEGVTHRQSLIDAAPHLVHPVQFLYPVHEGDPDPLWMLRIGMMMYDWFAGPRNLLKHRVLDQAGVLADVPVLKAEGLRGGALYADCITDDARLTVSVARAAAGRGAVLANYVEVTRFLYDAAGRAVGVEAVDRLGGGEPLALHAKAILNATGPWVDHLREMDEAGRPPVLRPTKGVHLTVPRERLPIGRPVVMHGPDKRMMFAVPRGAFTYLGTTDTDYKDDPAGVVATREDVTYILRAANHLFPSAHLTDADVVSTWAGLRTLAATSETAGPSQVSRDYKLHTSKSGVVSVAGGKLTAFQAMAHAIVRTVLPGVSHAEVELKIEGAGKAPSEAEAAALGSEYGLTGADVTELWSRYGTGSRAILAAMAPGSGRTGMLVAEAVHAVEHEFAVTLSDVLNRRTSQLLFSRDNGLGSVEAVATAVGSLLGWSETERQGQVAAYRTEVARMQAWKA